MPTTVTRSATILDVLPLWGLFLTIVLLVLAAIEAGYRLGSYRHRYAGREKEAPVGAMVGATLGLLAFMLAFTFGMAASRFDTRKQLVLDEANAIGTTYLRTAMLPEKRDEVHDLFGPTRMLALKPSSLAGWQRRFSNRKTYRTSYGRQRQPSGCSTPTRLSWASSSRRSMS